MQVIHISFGGEDRKIRDEKGRVFCFEDHPRFGPTVLNKTGDPAARQPSSRASFWQVCRWWAEQGKAVDADGFCVWSRPLPVPVVHLGGRHYRVDYEAIKKSPQAYDFESAMTTK